MDNREKIRIIHAALDQEKEGKGEIILRGRIEPHSLRYLKTGEYQREILPLTTLSSLVKAFKTSASVPDIELGLRGNDFTEVEPGTFELVDDLYIIDGLQRVSAARQVLTEDPQFQLRLGVKVYFGTTEASERERFRILNVDRTKLSPNVLLRNLKEELEVVNTLYRMTTEERSFVLRDRVCWTQRMTRDQLLTALTFAKTIGRLHAHIGSGRQNNFDMVASGLEGIMQKIGPRVFSDNVRTFFNVIDECFGLRTVVYKEGAVCLRSTFLMTFASVLSDHTDFWRESRLHVEKDLRRKIQTFPLGDPHVKDLAGAGGAARDILYGMMLEHINRGKRARRLTARSQELLPTKPAATESEPPIEAHDEEEAVAQVTA